VALTWSVWSRARWSIQTTTFCSSEPVGLTVTGRSSASRATSEHVASKPMPLIASGVVPASFNAARTARPADAQMSSELCSTKSSWGFHIRIGSFAEPSRRPVRSKMPARTLPVPTSIPR